MVQDLALSRGGVPLLEGVGFSLEPGAALTISGPNGTGKTTLLRALAGLAPITSGTVEVDPDDLLLLGHLDAVKPALTVTENLSFWAGLFGGPADVTPALEALDLARLALRPAGTLSAGQKRRLGLARLAVIRRALWLLDEPTVSLDAASVACFGDLVRAHLATGGAAIIATHIDLGLETLRLDLGTCRARPA